MTEETDVRVGPQSKPKPKPKPIVAETSPRMGVAKHGRTR
jgi:hypothetical protein